MRSDGANVSEAHFRQNSKNSQARDMKSSRANTRSALNILAVDELVGQSSATKVNVHRLVDTRSSYKNLSVRSHRSKKSGKTSNTHGPTHDYKFDYKRMDFVNIMFQKIYKAKSFSSTVEIALENLTKMINCRIGQVIIFKKNLVNRIDLKSMIVQKDIVDGHYYDVVANTDVDLALPAFKKFQDASTEIATKQYLSFPLYQNRKEMIGTIQVEAKFSVEGVRGDHNSLAEEKVKGGIRHYSGFGQIDRIVLHLIKTCIELKVDTLLALEDKKLMEQEVLDTIKIAGVICNQRSKVELVKAVK